MAIKKNVAVSFFLLLSACVFSQDSISVKDAQEIRYKAESLIKRELQDLLNNVSQSGFDSKETEEIISNSYSSNSNKIFESEKVIVESDLNPKIHGTNTAGDLNDITIVKYLKDFDILYTKSDNFSIAFSDIRSSQVKRAEYLYVKVYFSSFFNNKYKGVEGETPYILNNRVAEIKIINANDKWTPYISGISFFQPADTLNDIVNDVALKREPGQGIGTNIDSLTAASIDAEIEAKKKQQLIDEENAAIQQFNNLINSGDKALDGNNFTDALNYYRQARELMPYDPLPRNKISMANKLKERMNVTKEQLFKDYNDNARLAVRKREYEEAIRLYRLALDNKPTEKANLQPEIEALTKKVNFLTEMNLNFKAGNYKESIKQYTAAIKKKKDSDYFLGRARSNFKMAEYDDAMSDYTSAYELDNENLAAIEERGDLHKYLGDAIIKSKKTEEKKDHYIKALTDYSAYLNINRKNLRVYEACSELQMLLYDNVDDAIKPLDAGLEADSKAAQLYVKKGLLLMQKKDFRKADINFSMALKLDSNDAFAYYNRGVCQLNFNNIQAASNDFETARRKKLDSSSLASISAYGVSYFDRSVNDFKIKSFDSAVRHVDDAILIDPHKSLYHFHRGEYSTALRHYKIAIQSYDKAIELNNSYIDAYYKRGLNYYYLGDYKLAIEDFNKAAVATNPHLYLVQKGVGDAYLAANDYSKASQSFEKAIKTASSLKSEPGDEVFAVMYNALGKSYFYQSAFDKAIEAGKNAIRKDNSYAEAYFDRGRAYQKSGRLKDAIDDIAKAVSLDAKKNEWRYQLARCQQDNGDLAGAINNYSQTIAADTLIRLSDAVCYRGQAYFQVGNFANALGDYLNCASSGLDTTFTRLDYELGNIYLNLGKYDSANMYYQKVLQKDANNGWAMYGMGSSFFLKGDAQEALGWFEKSFKTKAVNSGEIKKDKLIANFRNDKSFKALMKKYY